MLLCQVYTCWMPHDAESRVDSRGVADEEVWKYREQLASLARHLCRDPDDAEDVAHDALVKAARNIDGFRGEATVSTWLHTITLNECRMLRRRKRSASLDELSDTEALVDRSAEADPHEIAEEAELRMEVLEAIAELPDRERCALLLREGSELSMEEMATTMGSTVPAVKSLLYRARSDLRARLAG